MTIKGFAALMVRIKSKGMYMPGHASSLSVVAEQDDGDPIPLRNIQSMAIKIRGGEMNEALIKVTAVPVDLLAVLKELCVVDKDGNKWCYSLVRVSRGAPPDFGQEIPDELVLSP